MLKDIIKKLNISDKSILVIGCSSGPDSMALLHYIKNNTKNNIVVAHINHNLRKESKEEEKYIKEYCKTNNIIIETYKIENYNKTNIENQAREKRYEFYNQVLNKYNTKYLFLAHHGDDLIETILMKIERGSDIEGYAGIKEISYPNQYRNYYILRPFLNYTKDELIKYNKENNIKYYIDKTNEDTKYTRAWYRINILPKLKERNKNIHKNYLKYSKELLDSYEYIKKEIDKYQKEIYQNNYIDIIKFKNIDPYLQKKLLYKIINNIYNDKPNIVKEKHINNILNIINSKKPNQTINLPHNIIIQKEYTKLYIKNNINNNYNYNYKIEFNNKFKLDNIIIEKINNIDTDGNNICRLNSKEIKLPLYIRNKKEKDTIILKGLNKHKKIKEIFIENKIPINIRNKYPILVDSNDNILWVPNLKKSKFNSKINEKYDIILKYCEKEENNE